MENCLIIGYETIGGFLGFSAERRDYRSGRLEVLSNNNIGGGHFNELLPSVATINSRMKDNFPSFSKEFQDISQEFFEY